MKKEILIVILGVFVFLGSIFLFPIESFKIIEKDKIYLESVEKAQIQNWDINELIKGNVPAYTIRQGHPRLLITPDNRAEIIAKIKNNAYASKAYQAVINKADGWMSKNFTSATDSYITFTPYIESFGIIYQLGKIDGFTYKYTIEEYGQKGREALMALARIEGNKTTLYPGHERATALPLGFDWLYPLLNESERKTIIEININTIGAIWPFTNVYASDSIWVAYPQRIALMQNLLAVYGEDVVLSDDRNSSKVVANMTDIFLKKAWWGEEGSMTRREILHAGGVTEAEIGYAALYANVIPAIAAWYTATGQDYFQAGKFWREFPKWFLNDYFPHDEPGLGMHNFVKMPETGADNDVLEGSSEQLSTPSILGASTSWLSEIGEDEYASAAAWAAELPSPTEATFLYGVLIGKGFQNALSPSEAGLPLYHLNKGPIGRIYFRSEWDNSNATYIMHAIEEYTCLRTGGSPQNSIVIWKNGGTLFTHQEGYHHDYGPDSRYNNIKPYYSGDYAEFFPDKFNLDPYISPDSCPDIRNVSLILSHKGGFSRGAIDIPGKYAYSSGDESNWLKGYTNGAINSSDRQIIWFPSNGDGKDYFFIYDRVKTDGSIAPHIIFNTVQEPITSVNFDTPISGASNVIGHWVVKNAPAITITNVQTNTVPVFDYGDGRQPAHARMFAKVLLPKNPVIHKLGGIGGFYHFDIKLINEENGKNLTSFAIADNQGTIVQIVDYISANVSLYRVGQELIIEDVNTGVKTARLNITTFGTNRIYIKLIDGRSGYGKGKDATDVTFAMQINDKTYFTNGRADPNGLDATRPSDCNISKPCRGRAFNGIWNFHIVNGDLEKDNKYLMAMEATDSSQASPSGEMILLEGAGLVGGVVGDSVGLFNLVYNNISSGMVNFVGKSGNYRIVIADLAPNYVYNVGIGGASEQIVASEAGTIYLEKSLNTNDVILVSQGVLASCSDFPNGKICNSGLECDVEEILTSDGACCIGNCVNPPLRAPTNLIASLESDGVHLSWNDNSDDETGFVIERKIGNGNWGEIDKVGVNVTNYIDSEVHLGPGIQGENLIMRILEGVGEILRKITGYIVKI